MPLSPRTNRYDDPISHHDWLIDDCLKTLTRNRRGTGEPLLQTNCNRCSCRYYRLLGSCVLSSWRALRRGRRLLSNLCTLRRGGHRRVRGIIVGSRSVCARLGRRSLGSSGRSVRCGCHVASVCKCQCEQYCYYHTPSVVHSSPPLSISDKCKHRAISIG